ncbi:MAG: hypothetical protein ACPGVU_08280 [Limisphaerales bacterium]
MDSDKLIDVLLKNARETPVGDGVPYAFEKRIMAHIRDTGVAEPWFNFARVLWRAVPVFVVVSALAITVSATQQPPATDDLSLAVSFEDAVVQSADFFKDTW